MRVGKKPLAVLVPGAYHERDNKTFQVDLIAREIREYFLVLDQRHLRIKIDGLIQLRHINLLKRPTFSCVAFCRSNKIAQTVDSLSAPVPRKLYSASTMPPRAADCETS